VLFYAATFFCARKNASHFSSSGAKKRQLPPERYARFWLEFFGKYRQNILIVI